MSEPRIVGEYQGVPLVITTGPSVRMSHMWCGRTFRSYLRTPTPRKERYHERVIRRHQRRCTACKRAKHNIRPGNIRLYGERAQSLTSEAK